MKSEDVELYGLKDLWLRILFLKYSLTIFLISFFITEALNKVFKYENSYFFLAPILKTLVLIYAFTQIFKYPKKVKEVLILVIFFIIGQLFLDERFDKMILINTAKYLFLIVLVIYVNKNRPSEKALKRLFLVFEYIMILNSVLIIIGLLFNVFYFKTYYGIRPGYNGFLITSATSTYVYMIVLFYFYLKYKSKFIFKLKPQLIIISSFIIGTKGAVIALIGILLLYVFQQEKKSHKLLAIAIIAIASSIGLYFILFKTNLLTKIYYRYDILTAFLSYRNKLLMEKMIPFIKENWSLGNYLFGGINSISTRSQMGFFDVFYFFGSIGSIYYIYVLIKNYLMFQINKINSLFLVLILLLIFLSGNFFLNASVVIYVLILRESMVYYNDKTIQK